MEAGRLTFALGATATLIGLALLTWIAVRVEQAVRKPSRLPAPRRLPGMLRRLVRRPRPEPERCSRLHVADLPGEWSRLSTQRRSLPFPSEDDPPFPPRS